MNTVQNNTASTSLLAAMNPASAAPQSTAAAAQDTFMKLLVTQMQNQDPLNPLDNAQVTSQLAQLSTVTGIDKMNTTLQSLIGSYQSSQTLQAAGMIGHDVLAAGSSLSLSNGQATFGINLPGPADAVKITILDASGRPVHSMDLGSQPAGMLPLQWDGTTDSGAAAASGQYSFTVSATQGGQSVNASTLAFGQVASVASSGQGVMLNVPGLGAVNLADVQQIF
ncbi:MAG TPA: flagellar hook assembly protein FlgD [Sulfuriferula sp.]|nr:flagellar hook assembly protein FlgD [Sulfuriferula sp.]